MIFKSEECDNFDCDFPGILFVRIRKDSRCNGVKTILFINSFYFRQAESKLNVTMGPTL